MTKVLKLNIVHFSNGSGGGVLSVIKNLLLYRQNENLQHYLIYVIKKGSSSFYRITDLQGIFQEQLFQYTIRWNFYSSCRKLSKLLPDKDSVIVAHDWFELGMVSHLGLPNPVVLILHGNYDYYYTLAIAHEQNIEIFICIAESIKEKLIEKLPHRRADIYYRRFPVNEPVKKIQQGNVRKAVFIGRCELLKGYPLLPVIDAELSRQNCGLEWSIIGAGSLTKENQTIWPAYSKVSFLGEHSNEKVLGMLADFDLIVLPSLAEGMPVAIIEAMKAGVIPIVNDLPGGMEELVENGLTGYRISGNKPEDYAARIKDLMENAELAKALSTACIIKADELFNAPRNATGFEELFIKATTQKRVKIKRWVYGSRLDKAWIPNFVVFFYRRLFGRKKIN